MISSWHNQVAIVSLYHRLSVWARCCVRYSRLQGWRMSKKLKTSLKCQLIRHLCRCLLIRPHMCGSFFFHYNRTYYLFYFYCVSFSKVFHFSAKNEQKQLSYKFHFIHIFNFMHSTLILWSQPYQERMILNKLFLHPSNPRVCQHWAKSSMTAQVVTWCLSHFLYCCINELTRELGW